MIAQVDLFQVKRFAPNPRPVIGSSDAWVPRTVGGALALPTGSSLDLSEAIVCSAFASESNAVYKISWIAIYGQIGFPITCGFNQDTLSTVNNTPNTVKTYSDGGSGTDLPKIMIKIPYQKQFLRQRNISSTAIFANISILPAVGPTIIYWRVGLKFKC